jgi:hypothetical protein
LIWEKSVPVPSVLIARAVLKAIMDFWIEFSRSMESRKSPIRMSPSDGDKPQRPVFERREFAVVAGDEARRGPALIASAICFAINRQGAAHRALASGRGVA